MRALSKGLQQRLGIAQAILNKPKLLILDEPFSGLDPSSRREIRELFRALQNDGTTIFLSSHILPDIEDLCHRVAILKQGKLVRSLVLSDIAQEFGAEYHVRCCNLPQLPEAMLTQATRTQYAEGEGWLIRVPSLSDAQEIIDWLRKQGGTLLGLEASRPSLEDVYLKVSGVNGGQMIRQVRAVALNTYAEAIRNKVLYSVVLFAVVVEAIASFFGTITIGSQVNVIKDFGLFALSLSGAVLTIVIGVSLLNRELKQKTIHNILSKPITRSQFLVGKLLGMSLTVWTLVALMGVSLIVVVAFIEKRLDPLLFQAFPYLFLEILVIAAIAIFFSALVVTTTLTAIFTLAAYIAGRSLPYLDFFISEDSSSFTKGLLRVVRWIVPDLSFFNVSDALVYGLVPAPIYLGQATLYALGYSFMVLVAACLVFRFRELT